MSNAKRPSLARKTTRKEKERQDSSLEVGAQFTIDGETYRIVMGDLSALDIMALRKQVGITFPALIGKLFDEDDSDIDLIAAVLWLARRVNGDEPNLKYEEVAAEVGYDVIEKIRESAEEADDVDEDKDPESLDPEG